MSWLASISQEIARPRIVSHQKNVKTRVEGYAHIFRIRTDVLDSLILRLPDDTVRTLELV